MATALELYCTGSLNLFNHPTNVDLTARVVCIVLKGLGKTCGRSPCTSPRFCHFGGQREFPQRHFDLVLLDEFHILLRDALTASYFVAVWKMLRKKGCVPSALTQNVKDLLASREIEAILDNTDFMILLAQAQSDRAILAKQLGISEHQLSYITHSNSGEGLLFYGDVTIPFVDRFPKGEIYNLLTTRPEDLRMKRKPNRPNTRCQWNAQAPGRAPRSWRGRWGRLPGDAGAADSGTSGQSVRSQNFGKRASRTGRRVQAPYGKARGKAGGAKDKPGKAEAPKKPGPVRRVGRAAGGTVHGFVHGKLFEVEQENVGTEEPTVPSWRVKPPCGMAPASSRRKSGNTGKGCPAGGVQIYQGYAGSSVPRGGPGAPGAGEKCLETVLAETAIPQAGTADRQGWGGKGGKTDCRRHGKSRSPGGGLHQAASRGGAPGPGLCVCSLIMQSCSSSLADVWQLRRGGRGRYHLSIKG